MTFIQIVLALAVAVWLFYRRRFGYWSRKKVPAIPPTFPLGNTGNPLRSKLTPCLRLQNLYDFCKKLGAKHCGAWIMWRPIYVPVEPEIIKRIMVSDCDNFLSRGFYTNEKGDPLSAMVFLLSGQKWKRLRTLLTPTFTSGKMKAMFPVLEKCGLQLVQALEEKSGLSCPVDIKEFAFCYTTDVICACSFGMDCNTCHNPDEEIRRHGRNSLNFNKLRAVKNFATLSFPKLCKLFNVKLVPKDISDFFVGTMRKAVDYRRTNSFERKDLLQSMMEMVQENKLSFDELTAQAFAFFLAGFETSAATITFCMLELAQNVEIQEKARRDVEDVVAKHDGRFTYEAISEMTYLRQVIEETLRKYPPVPITIRKCTKDYDLPGTDLTIESGTLIYILIRSLHHDPDHFPNPDVFDPERFSKENRSHIKPFTYLPFGDGPRNCLGARFGMIQSSLAIASILRNFRFKLHPSTQIPIVYNHNNISLDIESLFALIMEKIC